MGMHETKLYYNIPLCFSIRIQMNKLWRLLLFLAGKILTQTYMHIAYTIHYKYTGRVRLFTNGKRFHFIDHA